MTTIVYDHENQLIAYDSRITAGNLIVSDSFEKLAVCKNDLTWVVASTIHDTEAFINNFSEHAESGVALDVDAFVIDDGKVYNAYVSDGVFKRCPLSNNEAIGSGSRFALAAMDFGKSAKEAVEYAATRDSSTGGEIKVIEI